jgi:glycosyltransferase involved in cell wall biosynthesis
LKELVSKMRIMLLVSGDLWAGAEVMVTHLSAGLSRRDEIDLLVVLMNSGRLADELQHLGVKVHIVEESKYSFLKICSIVRGVVKNYAPDIIHSHRYKENMLAWCVSRGMPDCKLVATQHGMPENAGSLSRIHRLRNSVFFRLLATCFARAVFVSDEMRRSIGKGYGFSEKKVHVIHNGITVPQFVISLPREHLIVGSAGRLFPVKDYGLFVDVARLVVAQNNTVDFVLAGDGPERGMLEGQVRKCGLGERFRFLGHQEDMAAFYKGLDVYVNTSVHEGIPMSVLEAMAYGVPVVVPKVGGFPEIVEDGVGGFLVDSRDPEAFARRILQLLDPERRKAMGNNARERVVASFSREAMAQQYYRLYRELIDEA